MWQINKYKRAYIYIYIYNCRQYCFGLYIYIYAHKKSPYLSLTNKHVYNGVIAGQSLYKRQQIHFMYDGAEKSLQFESSMVAMAL